MTCIGDAVTSFLWRHSVKILSKNIITCIFTSMRAILMIFFVSNVFWVRKSTPTSHKCVTFTDDLETQSHVMLYVTFTNSGCVCAILMIFLCLMFFGSGNPFQLVTNAWPLRMTLKLKVTWCCAWSLLTLPVFVLSWWILYCFKCFLSQRIHSN